MSWVHRKIVGSHEHISTSNQCSSTTTIPSIYCQRLTHLPCGLSTNWNPCTFTQYINNTNMVDVFANMQLKLNIWSTSLTCTDICCGPNTGKIKKIKISLQIHLLIPNRWFYSCTGIRLMVDWLCCQYGVKISWVAI